jgi:hypothetical protein
MAPFVPALIGLVGTVLTGAITKPKGGSFNIPTNKDAEAERNKTLLAQAKRKGPQLSLNTAIGSAPLVGSPTLTGSAPS